MLCVGGCDRCVFCLNCDVWSFSCMGSMSVS